MPDMWSGMHLRKICHCICEVSGGGWANICLKGLPKRSAETMNINAKRGIQNRFRLICATPLDVNRVAAAFERLADAIQARDHCSRLEALQRACDENSRIYDEYVHAFKRP